MKIITRTTLTCPHCGFSEEIEMPTDRCVVTYECPACHTILTPKEGSCCVFCSYGTAICPPVQMGTCSGNVA